MNLKRKNMNKKISISLLVIVFLLACCNNNQDDKKSETGIKKIENEDIKISKNMKKPIPEVARNLDDALKIFHDHNFGEANMDSINIDKIKVEFTNKLFILKIEGFKNGKIYRLKIDDNAQILEEKIEKDKNEKKLALDFDKLYPPTKAMEKTLENQAKGAWVRGYELKIENNKAVYYINIAEGRDVMIDGANGEIIDKIDFR